MLIRVASLLALIALFVACGDDYVGEPTPNFEPETDITGFPPSPTSTETTVEFRWTGSDVDGALVGYDWALANNGTDGCVDPEEIAGLIWTRTELTSITLRVPVSQEVEPGFFTESYSFWVRSVDDKGAVDPSPACLAFTARTLAPIVEIQEPAADDSGVCRDAPQTVRFRWTTQDLDIQEDDVLQTRWVLLPWSDTGGACFTQSDFETSNPIAELEPDDPRWSEWADYDPAAPVTATKIFDGLTALEPVLFAVQARDPDGAVSTFFRWDEEVRSIRPLAGVAPVLTVFEPALGLATAEGSQSNAHELFEGESIQFSWSAEVAAAQGIVDGYRYGWGVTNPLNPDDPNWAIDWDPDIVSAPAHPAATSDETFVVAARSADGEITTLSYELSVVAVPAWESRKDLLLVDDTRSSFSGDPWEVERDSHWNGALQLAGVATWDVIEAEIEPQLLSFELLAGYKAVIWAGNANQFSFLRSEWAAQARSSRGRMPLQRYQSAVGNLLLCGPGIVGAISEPSPPSGPNPIVFATRDPSSDCWDSCAGALATVPTNSWAHSGLCLSMIERVRPALGEIYEETSPETIARNIACDALLIAEVAAGFSGQVVSLQPRANRLALDPQLQLGIEEAYDNFEVWRDRPILGERVFNCSEPMFLHSSRFANDALVDVSACVASLRPVDGAVCGLRVTTYSDAKQQPDSADYLWGFEVAGFEVGDVAAALEFVLADWGVLATP